MATINITPQTLAYALLTNFLLGCAIWYFSLGWVERRRREREARLALTAFDSAAESVDNIMERARHDDERRTATEVDKEFIATVRDAGVDSAHVPYSLLKQVASERIRRRAWVRIRPQNLRAIAASVADEAFYEYGAREMSQANMIITRKFLRDLLRLHKDLRAKDASVIIEMALPLSFVCPSETFEMQDFMDTRAFAARVQGPVPRRK